MRSLRFVLIAAFLLSVAAWLSAKDNGDDTIAAKALELAPAEKPASDRIVALHRFVRDEIRQTATQYG